MSREPFFVGERSRWPELLFESSDGRISRLAALYTAWRGRTGPEVPEPFADCERSVEPREVRVVGVEEFLGHLVDFVQRARGTRQGVQFDRAVQFLSVVL